jgi:UPF0755 protein
MRKLIAGCVITLLFIGVAVVWNVYPLFYRPMPRNANGTVTLTVISIEKNSSAVSFVHELKNRYLIESPRLFLMLIRLQGYANQLKAGIYEIKPGETAQDLLRHVVAGDVLILPFRITDGTTQRNIASQVEQLPYLIQQSDVWAKIAEGHASAEGLLLADTYHYDAGTNSNTLLMTAHLNLMRYLNDAFEKRAPNLPYKTPYELLTAASIIEKEASKLNERRLIAGVIVNRLRIRMPLQMDPTVIYALGSQYQGKLTHADLSIDSPYNTYKYYGLPPTPIAMVGRDAIDAAAHPASTHYLYFVASGNGCHHFSETYERQRKAISDYKIKVEPCQE